jgi:ACS family hexuronate transporter-like MFS transporter
MPAEPKSTPSQFRLPGLRWWIAGMLFLAAALNYADKNTLSLLAPTIQKDLHFGDQAYANIQNAFQVAYTIALLCSGFVVDKLGSRISMGLFLGWWSVANMLTAWAGSLASMGVFRSLLGFGEGGNWTASPKAVSQWFPAREQGFAMGIYTAGTPVGMTLAPFLVIGLTDRYGWRSAFVVTGALGLLWLVPWLVLCRAVKTHPWLGDAERALIQSDECATYSLAPSESGWTWLQAFCRLEVWLLLVGRMLSDPIWFFYQNWFPKYLVSVRGLTQSQVKIVWVMFLAAGLGSLIGGWISGHFIRRGGSPRKVRLLTMLGCALFMPLSALVPHVPSVSFSLFIASAIIFVHLAWLVNISALVLDVVPKKSVGTVFGIVAAGSSVGAIAMNSLVANLVQKHSYTSWFNIAAVLHLLVIGPLIWGLLGRKNRNATMPE